MWHAEGVGTKLAADKGPYAARSCTNPRRPPSFPQELPLATYDWLLILEVVPDV